MTKEKIDSIPSNINGKEPRIIKREDCKDTDNKWFHCSHYVPEPEPYNQYDSIDVLAYNGEEYHIAYYTYKNKNVFGKNEAWTFLTRGTPNNDPNITIWRYLPNLPTKLPKNMNYFINEFMKTNS